MTGYTETFTNMAEFFVSRADVERHVAESNARVNRLCAELAPQIITTTENPWDDLRKHPWYARFIGGDDFGFGNTEQEARFSLVENYGGAHP